MLVRVLSMRKTSGRHRTSIILLAGAVASLLAVLLLAACGGDTVVMGKANPGKLRDNTPRVIEASQPGVDVIDNGKVTVDFSNIADGYFSVKSKISPVKMKVLVDVQGTRYQYTIVNTEEFVIIPFSQGSGSYSIGVWENITGDQYAAVASRDVQVTLKDDLAPFLRSNQYVSFKAGDASTTLSQKSAEGATSDTEAINGIYHWIVTNVTYDETRAFSASHGELVGYLPDNTATIEYKTGICFDYAVLAVSMLREQGIPAKLVIGYAGSAYHAWIEIYNKESGKIYSYTFDGKSWERMDPTFDAASKGTRDLSSIIGDGRNYQAMFYY